MADVATGVVTPNLAQENTNSTLSDQLEKEEQVHKRTITQGILDTLVLSAFATQVMRPERIRESYQQAMQRELVSRVMNAEQVKNYFFVEKPKDTKDKQAIEEYRLKLQAVNSRVKALEGVSAQLRTQFGDALFDPKTAPQVQRYINTLLDPQTHPTEAKLFDALKISGLTQTKADGTEANIVAQELAKTQEQVAQINQEGYQKKVLKRLGKRYLGFKTQTAEELQAMDDINAATVQFFRQETQQQDVSERKEDEIWRNQALLTKIMYYCVSHSQAYTLASLQDGMINRYIALHTKKGKPLYKPSFKEEQFLRKYAENYTVQQAHKKRDATQNKLLEAENEALYKEISAQMQQTQSAIEDQVLRQQSEEATEAASFQNSTSSGMGDVGGGVMQSVSNGMENVLNWGMDIAGKAFTGGGGATAGAGAIAGESAAAGVGAVAGAVGAEAGAVGGAAAGVGAVAGAGGAAAGAAGTAAAGGAAATMSPVLVVVLVIVVIFLVLIVFTSIISTLSAGAQPQSVENGRAVAAAQSQNKVTPEPTSNITAVPTIPPVEGPPIQQVPTTLQAVIDTAAQAACIPNALLTAISSHEASGTWTMTADQFNFYNTPGWWTQGITKAQACRGYDYNTCTNAILFDTTGLAGQYCGSGPVSLPCHTGAVVSGPMQFEIGTWHSYQQKVQTALGRTVDPRTIVDAFTGAAFKIKSDSKNSANSSCTAWTNTTWTQKDLENAAQGYAGGRQRCVDTSTGTWHNVCKEVCDLYNGRVQPEQQLNCQYFWDTYGKGP